MTYKYLLCWLAQNVLKVAVKKFDLHHNMLTVSYLQSKNYPDSPRHSGVDLLP